MRNFDFYEMSSIKGRKMHQDLRRPADRKTDERELKETKLNAKLILIPIKKTHYLI